MAVSSSDMVFVAQWSALRTWAVTLPSDLTTPTVLEGWTVEHLMAHLVRTADSVAALRPARPGVTPLTVSEYLAGYAAVGSADALEATRRQIADEMAGDIVSAMDAAYAQAARTMSALGASDRTVAAGLGPILLSDFLDTRLIELVVHSGDLARSMPWHPAPRVMPAARRRVVQVLREVLAARAEDPAAAVTAVEHLDADEFLGYATGRDKVPDKLAEQTQGALPLL